MTWCRHPCRSLGVRGSGGLAVRQTARPGRRRAALVGGRRARPRPGGGRPRSARPARPGSAGAGTVLAPPRCVEPAARQHRHPMPQRRLRERGPVAVRQADPEGLPAAHRRHLPVGQVTGPARRAGDRGGPRRSAACCATSASSRGSSSAAASWPGMFPPRSCTASSRASRAISGSGARTQPTRSPPQTILLSEPTEITRPGEGGQRRRHRLAGEPQLAEHLVVDQRDPGGCAGLAQRPPGEQRQHRPVGLWKVGIT